MTMRTLGTLTIQGNTAPQSPNRVQSAIYKASARTGVDFDYLLTQAKVESSLNPAAKARTSSATGLYQFIDQTWLQTLKTHGPDHGYGQYASAIRQNRDGDFFVADRRMRSAILNLRKDPEAASLMAASLAQDNRATLESAVNRPIESTDLYLAHFLGAGGASSFIKALEQNPHTKAAHLFPDAAQSNRGVFYEGGRARTLAEIYNRFDSKFDQNDPLPIETASAKPDPFMEQVILPLANNWSDPDSNTRTAQNIILQGSRTGLRAFTRDMDGGNNTETASNNTGGEAMWNMPSFKAALQSPVDVMMIAQAMDEEATPDASNPRLPDMA